DLRIGTLRSLDKFDKFGWGDVYLLLTAGRLDESGDFTKGVGLAPEVARLLYRLFAPVRVLSAPDEPLSCSIGNDSVSFGGQTKLEFFQGFRIDDKPMFSEEEILSDGLDW